MTTRLEIASRILASMVIRHPVDMDYMAKAAVELTDKLLRQCHDNGEPEAAFHSIYRVEAELDGGWRHIICSIYSDDACRVATNCGEGRYRGRNVRVMEITDQGEREIFRVTPQK